MRRLFPPAQPGEADQVSVREAYDVLREPHGDRPWVTVCMISSVDGTTVVDGTSGALGNATDTEVLVTMRSLVDVVLVGAQTVRLEGYGVPSSPTLRIGVVSRSGDGLDFASLLWQSGRAFLIVPEDAPDVDVPSIRAGHGSVDLGEALAQLDARVVQCEGGPSLNGELAAADLIDEITLTVSPVIAGGDGPRLTAHAPQVMRGMHLAHVMEQDGFLYTRYVRAR